MRQPEKIGMSVDRVVAALVPATHAIALGSAESRDRRDVQREVDRQIARAMWRAERRARQVPQHVRHSVTYVMARRRKIAYQVSRAVKALGAGDELANAIAEKAAIRYPRDGIILPDTTERAERPRVRGDNPRQLKTNPRAKGTSPRQLEESPRQKRRRAPADLSRLEPGYLDKAAASSDLGSSTFSSTDVARVDGGRNAPPIFLEAWEAQTRALMDDMAKGINVTKAMTKEQREKFYARVRELRRRDHRRLKHQDGAGGEELRS